MQHSHWMWKKVVIAAQISLNLLKTILNCLTALC